VARARKCDRPKVAPTLPPKVVCPICKRPPSVFASGAIGCTFMERCSTLAIGKQEKADYFRRFHADVCESCRLPKEECRAKRITRVKSRLTRDVKSEARVTAYVSPEKLRLLVDAEKCVCPDKIDYTPIMPEWWVE
jgi:hypothetical protein